MRLAGWRFWTEAATDKVTIQWSGPAWRYTLQRLLGADCPSQFAGNGRSKGAGNPPPSNASRDSVQYQPISRMTLGVRRLFIQLSILC